MARRVDGVGVHYSLLVPQNLQVSCGYAPSPTTGYGDFVVVLSDVDLSSGCDGGTLTEVPDPGAGHPFVRIEVESPSYRGDWGALMIDGGPVAAIVPGVYPIGFDNFQDDICELSSGLAIVDVMRFTDASCCSLVNGEALSGAVTLTTVDQGHVAGSFQVSLAPQDGGVAGAAPLSGHFDTTTCPGLTQ